MTDLLADAYGISQLECDDTFCAWLDADGQPAAGTMVECGSRAGLRLTRTRHRCLSSDEEKND